MSGAAARTGNFKNTSSTEIMKSRKVGCLKIVNK